jgi:hypothetical protein
MMTTISPERLKKTEKRLGRRRRDRDEFRKEPGDKKSRSTRRLTGGRKTVIPDR